jgi:hypothetical protein
MSACTCPEDRQTVPSSKRVLLLEPGAVRKVGNMTQTDRSKVHIFSADCPVHGYSVIDPE